MFTVKATYRGEIRKFTFPECNSFPSFDQLYNQLYRVFPISHNYFLSKLLFSPDYSHPSRILIGREIHSADEYLQCISPFQGRSWHNALLRFSVFDETPHKIPSVVTSDPAQSSWNPSSCIAEQIRSHSAFQTSSANLDAQPPQPQPTPSHISMFHIPPPPIIYSSSSCTSSQPPMDVDPAPADRSIESHNSLFPQHNESQPEQDTQKPSSCCAVAHGKAEMEHLLLNFKLDLDRIITTSFRPSQTPPEPPIIVNPVTLEPPSPPQLTPMPTAGNPFLPVPSETSSSFCLYKYCTACSNIFQGPWYTCEKCNVVMCPGCHMRGLPNFCFPVQGPHAMKKETCAACPKSDGARSEQPPPSQHCHMPSSTPYTWPLPSVPPPQRLEPTLAQGSSSVTAFTDTMRPFYPYATPTQVMPFIPMSVIPEPPMPPQPFPAPPIASSMVVNPPVQPVQNDSREAPAPTPAPAPPPPVVHHGIVCDGCDKVVEGVRHKCLDCTNYDLCTPCINSGNAERHNPFHEFLELKEPGRVIVHTVFTGDGEREALPVNASRAPLSDVLQNTGTEEEPMIHNATCDLCDSRIHGNRYKCLSCPDFDTCTSCFSITPEQHPHHAFIKVAKPSDYISRESPVSVMHFATCNGCRGGIYGVRYKCMHPECPDFDLCEGCEAHPIPMHPSNHPLLKMRSADTVVPTVYRVGQTTLIDPQIETRGRFCGTSEVNRARTRPSGSFGRGYMRNPSARSSNLYNVLQARTHSPFYSPSRSRSRSRTTRSWATRSPSRSRSPPTIISGGLPSPPVYGGFNERDLHPPPVTMVPPPQPYPWHSRSYGMRSACASRHPSPRPLPVPACAYIRSRSPSYSPVRLHRVRRSRSRSWSPSYCSPLPSRPGSPIISGQDPYQFYPRVVIPSRSRSRSPRRYSPVHYRVPDYRQRSSSPRPSTPGWPPIFDTPVPAMTTHSPVEPIVCKYSSPSTTERSSPVQTETPSIPVESSGTHMKLPPLVQDPFGNTFRDMWPRTSQELRHLMQDTSSINDLRQTIATAFSQPLASQGSTATVVGTQRTQMVAESPLTGEALLNRPVGSSSPPEMKETTPTTHSLAALLSGNQSVTIGSSPLATSVSSVVSDKETPAIEIPAAPVPLLAEFLEDITVPDGQIFPPGAEFVKCWRFLNGSERDWPESTVLRFVAGESLARDESVSQSVKVGAVKAGAEVDLWTGELKAPDTPGRYVGYWRLSDGEGNLFGEVIWVDITVTEFSNPSKPTSSNESLSSSSIIVMPQSAPAQSQSSAPSLSVIRGNHDASSPMTSSPVTASSQPATDDAVSDDGSDGSSIELVSVPSSDDEDEPGMWEDSRSDAAIERARAAMEYVLLYDDNSSEEEEA